MKTWTSNGHLSELALEMWAAGEAGAPELQKIRSHVQACPECRARTAEWRGLFLALSSLRGAEPTPSFDRRVLDRVRLPVPDEVDAPAWIATIARRAPRIAAAGIGAWLIALVFGAAWLRAQLDVPAGLLLARLAGSLRELLLASAIKLGVFLQVSGLTDWWTEFSDSVPGPGVATAVALVIALSGLAIWMLHRVTGHQTPRMNAHAETRS